MIATLKFYLNPGLSQGSKVDTGVDWVEKWTPPHCQTPTHKFLISANIINQLHYDHHSGYMAPEYVMEGIFSMKSDVFSFGVLILEILSGRRINSYNHIEGPSNLVAFVSKRYYDYN